MPASRVIASQHIIGVVRCKTIGHKRYGQARQQHNPESAESRDDVVQPPKLLSGSDYRATNQISAEDKKNHDRLVTKPCNPVQDFVDQPVIMGIDPIHNHCVS